MVSPSSSAFSQTPLPLSCAHYRRLRGFPRDFRGQSRYRTAMRIALAVLILITPFSPARADTRPDVSFPLGLYSVYTEDLEAASRLGFSLVVANTFYDGTDSGRRRILDVRDEPNLVAHVVVDEPDIYGNPPERVERWVRGLAAIDTRPVYMTVWAPRNFAAYKPLADIFCPPPIPSPRRERRRTYPPSTAPSSPRARPSRVKFPSGRSCSASPARPIGKDWERPAPSRLDGPLARVFLHHDARG